MFGRALVRGFIMLVLFIKFAEYIGMSFEVVIIILVLMMFGIFGMASNTAKEVDRRFPRRR
jgi:hypothetical protein